MRLPTVSQPVERRPFLATKLELVPVDTAGVSPQLRICSPCLGLPSGKHCINLGPFGRRCVTIPNLGRWKICCRTRFGWPPVSCGIERCG